METEIDEIKLNEFFPEEGFLEVNTKGHLEFDGFDTVELVEKFGTPLYVISERKLRENYRRISKVFKTLYPHVEIAYAIKANPLLAVCKILREEGAWAEVVSKGELFIANLAGFEESKIVFDGCNKDRSSLRLAIKIGALINAESLREIEIIEEEAAKLGTIARIGIRINPIVKTGTLSEWETALANSKFGINIDKGIEAYKKVNKMKHIEVVGIHTHIGSQIETVEPYVTATERIMDLVYKLNKELGIEIEVIDLGGGFPIPFRYKRIPPIEEYARGILEVFNKKREEYGFDEPKIIIEPGGSIVGNTTLLLLRVGIIKREESSVKWAYVDGGADVNLRATQGWYVYPIVCCNKMNSLKKEKINIAGPLCYMGDVLGYNRELPPLEEGDILAMLDCGAYTISTWNRYNSHPLPAVVLIRKNKATLIRRRENLIDLVIGEEVDPYS